MATEKYILVVSLKMSDVGSFKIVYTLHEVFEFFKRTEFRGMETYFTMNGDGKPAEKLTKERTIKLFPYFEETKQYKHIIEGIYS